MSKQCLTRYLFLLACLLPAAPARCADDTFDAVDKMLDKNFDDVDARLEQQYQQINQAMEDAYRRLGQKVGKAWGKDQVRLPSRKIWVDYSPDLKTRRIFDFEHGKVELQRLVGKQDDTAGVVADLTHAANAATTDSGKDLADKDLALTWARKRLATQGIDIGAPQGGDATPVLKGVAPAIDDGSLKQAVESAIDKAASPAKPASPPAPDASGEVTAAFAAVDGKHTVTVEVPFAPDFKRTLASRYLATISRNASKRGLAASLVLAVMDTESAFNPRATSPIPAYGLMQLVPSSGAMDAYQYIHGDKVLLGPDYLYNPTQNVELGSAYLSLLSNRYLASIKDATSREYCTIAAYNTGAGNVARAFTGDTDVSKAAGIINHMTPGEVYKQLTTRLPYEETRRYLHKVTSAQKKYLGYDDKAGL